MTPPTSGGGAQETAALLESWGYTPAEDQRHFEEAIEGADEVQVHYVTLDLLAAFPQMEWEEVERELSTWNPGDDAAAGEEKPLIKCEKHTSGGKVVAFGCEFLGCHVNYCPFHGWETGCD